MPIRNCLFLLCDAKTYRISLASQCFDIHSHHFKLVTAVSESVIEACQQRTIGINGARNIQQQDWSRVASENNAGLELIPEAHRLVQLQMLATSIVIIHQN
jgi:hypothetical protein